MTKKDDKRSFEDKYYIDSRLLTKEESANARLAYSPYAESQKFTLPESIVFNLSGYGILKLSIHLAEKLAGLVDKGINGKNGSVYLETKEWDEYRKHRKKILEARKKHILLFNEKNTGKAKATKNFTTNKPLNPPNKTSEDKPKIQIKNLQEHCVQGESCVTRISKTPNNLPEDAKKILNENFIPNSKGNPFRQTL